MLKKWFVILALTVSAGCSVRTYGSHILDAQLGVKETYELIPALMGEIQGDSHAEQLVKLIQFTQGQGVPVVIFDLQTYFTDPEAEFLMGYYDIHKRRILIDIDQSINSMLSTLAHELGHFYQPNILWTRDAAGQTFAEAVAYLFCQRIGLNTWDSTGPYLQRHKEERSVLNRYAREIEEVVDVLTKAVQ